MIPALLALLLAVAFTLSLLAMCPDTDDDAHRLDWPADEQAQRHTADGTALL